MLRIKTKTLNNTQYIGVIWTIAFIVYVAQRTFNS